MKCKVYPYKGKLNTDIIVPSETNSKDLPLEIQKGISSSKEWKEIDINPDQPLIGLDPQEALKNIEDSGFHIQVVETKIEEKVK